MSKVVTTYHQRVAQEKRALIVTAATALFLELGYDRTSLARIAERSGVSRATLFKQFPSKAALFDAIVTESWSTADEEDPPPAGNVVDGLGIIGRRYAELLGRAPDDRPVQDRHRRAAAVPRAGPRAVLAREDALLRVRAQLPPG